MRQKSRTALSNLYEYSPTELENDVGFLVETSQPTEVAAANKKQSDQPEPDVRDR